MTDKKAPKLKFVTAENASETGLTPPRNLGEHGRSLWDAILAEYAIDDEAGRQMLALACAALDTAELCSAQIAADGPVIRTKGGAIREHPSIRGELANRSFVVRTLGRLGLDLEPLKSVGRPPLKSYSGER
jgi:hypothetical protein